MISFEEAYTRYIIKAEKNATNDNIVSSRQHFAKIFNESQNKYIDFLIKKAPEEERRHLHPILIKDKDLGKSKKTKTQYIFQLPNDYFDIVTSYVYISTECCSNIKLYGFPIDPFNENEILQDEFNKPSVLYRETPYLLSNNSLKIFYENFTIDKCVLNYYRKPTEISQEDSTNPESPLKKQFLDFEEKIVDKIISFAVGEFDMNNENTRYQIQKTRSVEV